MCEPVKTNVRADGRRGVLLLAHGAPDKLEDIPEFLLNVREGRKLPDRVVQEITRRYALIGGRSPLLDLTRRQAAALAQELGLPVYIGMRNWQPFIADAIGQMAADGVELVTALCMAPHNSRTSTGLYRRRLDEAVEKSAHRLSIEFIENWHDHPLLIAAFRDKLTQALDRAGAEAATIVPVIFTAHSVPVRTIVAGDSYERQVRETAALIGGSLAPEMLPGYRVAFQSQGMTAEPWIGPTVESQLDELVALGHRYVLLAPIGFVTDHVEILYDIDVMFRDYGKSKGLTVLRTESLNSSPLFIRALVSIITERLDVSASGGVR